MKNIYLDYASATPVMSEVEEVMQPYWSDKFHNPSALYGPARDVNQDIKEARHIIARLLGAKSAEIVFTNGASAANALAFSAIASELPSSRFACLAIEHESVLAHVAKDSHIEVEPSGICDLASLRKIITDETSMVSVGLINNEIGTIQSLRTIRTEIEAILEDRQRRGVAMPLYLHSDASQAGGVLDLKVDRLGVDLLTVNAAKMGGPKQVGALYVRTGIKAQVQQTAGTPSAALLVGFARAFELADKSRKDTVRVWGELYDFVLEELAALKDWSVNGGEKHRSKNNINISIKGISGEEMVLYLAEQGFLIGTGAACSANDDTPSHVLKALGLTNQEANASVRVTFGPSTSKEDLELFTKILIRTAEHLRRRAV